MKKYFYWLIILAITLLVSCSGDSGSDGENGGDDNGDPVVFAGKIEKGALQKGANITASEWSAIDGYSGKTYASETFDFKRHC